jgi:hypothetical protein
MTNNSWNSQDPVQVAKGGTGIGTTTAYSVLCGGTTATGAFQNVSGLGTAGHVLISAGAAALPAWGLQKLVQYVQTSTSATDDLTTLFPFDDTIPQNTEGEEVLTLAITPKNASNILLIKFNSFGSVTNTGCVAALFQDATAGALSASIWISALTDIMFNGVLNYKMAAGTTSATTFKVRMGPVNPGQHVYVNGSAGGRLFGGVASTTLEIWELTP